MKISSVLFVVCVSSGLLLGSGCGTMPKKGVNLTKEQILEQEDVKKKQPEVFNKGLEEVHQVAKRALVFVGCTIAQEQPYFLAGKRPHKVGLFVGSGGETVKIFLYPKSETETHVWTDTDLSFVGMAGQQSWDKQVIGQMRTLLP